MRKRLLAAVLVACLAAISAAGMAYAYLTDKNTLKNTFTAGINETKLMEDFDPVPLDTGENIYKKEVWVKNVGTVPCFVRLFLGFSDQGIFDITEFAGEDEEFYPVMEYNEHLPEGWIYDDTTDHYYYTKVLLPGEETTKVIHQVKTTFASEEEVRPYDLIAFEESINARSSDGTPFEGEDAYKKAWDEYLGR